MFFLLLIWIHPLLSFELLWNAHSHLDNLVILMFSWNLLGVFLRNKKIKTHFPLKINKSNFQHLVILSCVDILKCSKSSYPWLSWWLSKKKWVVDFIPHWAPFIMLGELLIGGYWLHSVGCHTLTVGHHLPTVVLWLQLSCSLLGVVLFVGR